MSKMKEIFIEIYNQFEGQIPPNFDYDAYIQAKIDAKSKQIQSDKNKK